MLLHFEAIPRGCFPSDLEICIKEENIGSAKQDLLGQSLYKNKGQEIDKNGKKEDS